MITRHSHDVFTTRIRVKGIVQGVGFRPFVYNLAVSHSLAGWVSNDMNGVILEVQGARVALDAFLRDLQGKAPRAARIDRVEVLAYNESAYLGPPQFQIVPSITEGKRNSLITPDLHVCDECLKELFDPQNRRYRYPFINCTNCGPRYSIIKDTPYDRPLTTMARFTMCPACRAEYENPLDRRYHAQPIACPICGPVLELQGIDGRILPVADPIAAAQTMLKDGKILGVKGIGGFHLVVDPHNAEAVKELRKRKRRYKKPFAIMCRTAHDASEFVHIEEYEKEILESPARPILLLPKTMSNLLAEEVSPGSTRHGVMLAYTPIHHLLLLNEFNVLLVTSANISDDPIVYDNQEAVTSLPSIVDAFLIHNRDIVARADDSVLLSWTSKQTGPRCVPIRRARGYAPDALPLPRQFPSMLALGAELKTTIGFNRDLQAFISPHIGDLKRGKILESYYQMINTMERQYDLAPEIRICDLHPQFLSTQYAHQCNTGIVCKVQHHHAHMAACMGENKLPDEPTIGVVFDGLGYGTDTRIWGGEFFVGSYAYVVRAGHFSYFKLPGGDKATQEIDRILLGMLFDCFGDKTFNFPMKCITNRNPDELQLLKNMVIRQINCPLCCSVGRLFDAAAALIGIRTRVEYEAQAAMELEAYLSNLYESPLAPFPFKMEAVCDGGLIVNSHSIICEMVQAILESATDKALLSFRFHSTIVAVIVDVCERLREKHKINSVVLSGGVFLNRFILSRTTDELMRHGFAVYSHRLVPPGDGGISYGQLLVAGFQSLAACKCPD